MRLFFLEFLFRYKEIRKWFLASVGVSLINGLLESLVVLFFAAFVNLLLNGEALHLSSALAGIYKTIEQNIPFSAVSCILISLIITKGFVSYLGYRLSGKYISLFETLMREEVIQKLINLKKGYFFTENTQDIANYTGEYTRELGYILKHIRMLTLWGMLAVVYLVLSFYISFYLTVSFIILFLLLHIVSSALMKKTYASAASYVEQRGSLILELRKVVNGWKFFLTGNRENLIKSRSNLLIGKLEKANFATEKVNGLQEPLRETGTYLSLILIFTIYQNTHQMLSITVPSFILLIFFIKRLGDLGTSMYAAYGDVLIKAPYWFKLKSFLSLDEDKADIVPEPVEKISIANICYKVGQQDYSIKNLSFKRGDIVCISGDSGSGKTSFIYLLLGFVPLKSGEITLNDKFVNKQMGANVHYQSQNSEFYWEECEAAESFSRNLAVELGVDSLLDKRPDIRTISGGEKQKIKILNSLVTKKEIIIYDEVFNNIDDKSLPLLIKEIEKKSKDKIIFFITHREEVRRSFDSRHINIADYICSRGIF